MALNPTTNGLGGRSRRGFRPMSEINVTPFVDVMLVLLIVFMVTAPLLTVGVPVELPRTDARTLADPDEPLVVTVTADGEVFLQETRVELPSLVPTLLAVSEANPEALIFVRGDRAIRYGTIMEIMGALNGAGFSRVALVTETTAARPALANEDR